MDFSSMDGARVCALCVPPPIVAIRWSMASTTPLTAVQGHFHVLGPPTTGNWQLATSDPPPPISIPSNPSSSASPCLLGPSSNPPATDTTDTGVSTTIQTMIVVRNQALVLVYLLVIASTLKHRGEAFWVAPVQHHQYHHIESSSSSVLYSQRPPSQPDPKKTTTTTTEPYEDDETPAGIVGAQFFGGNKEKEEFYDEVEERTALLSMVTSTSPVPTTSIPGAATTYCRFDNRQAFTSGRVGQVASSLQSQINAILYGDTLENHQNNDCQSVTYIKESPLDWVTPLTKSSPPPTTTTTPLDELQAAQTFYKHLDLAIVSGHELSQPPGNNTNIDNDTITMAIQWEVSVTWPTLWEPRVILVGSSTLTMQIKTEPNGKTTMMIIRQVDTLPRGDDGDGGDATKSSSTTTTTMTTALVQQLIPRFWDLYHVGMTPSAELSPKIDQRTIGPYQVATIPARWMVQPTVLETGTRLDGNAQIIPNHAFSSLISTMGPTRQRYVPTIGTTVQIRSNINNNNGTILPTLQWQIPMSVEFQSRLFWPLAPPNDEAAPNSDPQCHYIFQPKKLVAAVAYGGEAQDVDIGSIRKQLYERVLKDGLYTPKLDDNGRPIFYFSYGTTKACYTRNGGLGMCVYEWRPSWAKANQVGLELEIPREMGVLVPRPAIATKHID